MGNENFKKIRQAAREQAEFDGISEREVVKSFRTLRDKDPMLLEAMLTGLADTRDVKGQIGVERYQVFAAVAIEKEFEIQEEWSRRIYRLAQLPTQGQKMSGYLDLVAWGMDITEQKIRDDERIKNAFSGAEDKLDKLIQVTRTWTQSIDGSMVLHSMSTENPQ